MSSSVYISFCQVSLILALFTVRNILNVKYDISCKMMKLFILLLFFGCFFYSVIILILAAALSSVRAGKNKNKPHITVIIAARNERSTVGACLDSIMAQDYPSHLYEVIVADDRSTDGTSDILKHFEAVRENVKILRIDKTPEEISPKKHALSQAISHASGEIIVQTDADCIVPKSWITGIVRCFDENVGMAVGLSPYFEKPGLLNSFIRHEYLWNAFLAAGSIAIGRGTHATGRNLAFRKDVFERLNGYGEESNVISGDDTLLMHSIQKHSKSRIVSISDVSTLVYTDAPRGFMDFVRQRIRHMSTGRMFEPLQVIAGCVIYGFHILLLLSLFLIIGSLSYLPVFAGIFICKMLIDSLMALRAERILGLHVQWRRFLLNELFLVVYMAVMPILGVLVPVKWKEKQL